MEELQTITLDRDLMVLDEIISDSQLPERDWEAIIDIYNQNNKPFPIPPTICANIIREIKDGRIPKMVFKQRSISYTNFNNRYNKSKAVIEELSSKVSLTNEDWNYIISCKNDPAFILGQDIDRARGFHFNEATDALKLHSDANAITWLAYMKEIHKEEFEQKNEQKGVEVTINFAAGILESI